MNILNSVNVELMVDVLYWIALDCVGVHNKVSVYFKTHTAPSQLFIR